MGAGPEPPGQGLSGEPPTVDASASSADGPARTSVCRSGCRARQASQSSAPARPVSRVLDAKVSHAEDFGSAAGLASARPAWVRRPHPRRRDGLRGPGLCRRPGSSVSRVRARGRGAGGSGPRGRGAQARPAPRSQRGVPAQPRPRTAGPRAHGHLPLPREERERDGQPRQVPACRLVVAPGTGSARRSGAGIGGRAGAWRGSLPRAAAVPSPAPGRAPQARHAVLPPRPRASPGRGRGRGRAQERSAPKPAEAWSPRGVRGASQAAVRPSARPLSGAAPFRHGAVPARLVQAWRSTDEPAPVSSGDGGAVDEDPGDSPPSRWVPCVTGQPVVLVGSRVLCWGTAGVPRGPERSRAGMRFYRRGRIKASARHSRSGGRGRVDNRGRRRAAAQRNDRAASLRRAQSAAGLTLLPASTPQRPPARKASSTSGIVTGGDEPSPTALSGAPCGHARSDPAPPPATPSRPATTTHHPPPSPSPCRRVTRRLGRQPTRPRRRKGQGRPREASNTDVSGNAVQPAPPAASDGPPLSAPPLAPPAPGPAPALAARFRIGKASTRTSLPSRN